jgi:hypothetical protein
MEQNNEELNRRNQEWRSTFIDFISELRLCDSENLEPNLQNIDDYNSTRQRCQSILNNYVTRVERIVIEMEGTVTPRGIVNEIRQYLEQIIRDPIFEGILDQTTERVTAGVTPRLQGNNQKWSELSLVNHFTKLYNYYIRVELYLSFFVEGGRKKYRKSKKAKKSRKTKKSKKSKK